MRASPAVASRTSAGSAPRRGALQRRRRPQDDPRRTQGAQGAGPQHAVARRAAAGMVLRPVRRTGAVGHRPGRYRRLARRPTGAWAAPPRTTPRWPTNTLERVEAMYHRSRNHTCILAYALGGDAGNGYNMYKAYEWLKSVGTAAPGDLRRRRRRVELRPLNTAIGPAPPAPRNGRSDRRADLCPWISDPHGSRNHSTQPPFQSTEQ